MKILLDLQGAQTVNRLRGIGRYTTSLTRAMLRNAGDHEIHIGLSAAMAESIHPVLESLSDVLPEDRVRIWSVPRHTASMHSGTGGRRRLAEVVREEYLASLRPDLVHNASLIEGAYQDAVSSVGRYRPELVSSAVVYDFIPWLYPRAYLETDSLLSWYQSCLGELARTDLLLAISESSRQECLSVLRLEEHRVVTISAAVDDIFVPLALDEPRRQQLRTTYGIERDVVLYTGGADPRKNLEGLFDAFALLPPDVRTSHQLVIVGWLSPGRRGELEGAAQRAGLEGSVVFTGFVPDDDLVALYNLSRAFVFPSHHEGFGLPPLEAMRCGTPTITGDNSSLPEVVANPEARFDSHDPGAMARAIERVLTDDPFRQMLSREGLAQAATFSWDECARRALHAMERTHAATARRTATEPAPAARPRLAFVTGLPHRGPVERQYLAEIVTELDAHYEVDVVTEPVPARSQPSSARVVGVADLANGSYDRVLHHQANHPAHRFVLDVQAAHPGTVLLEDERLDEALPCRPGVADASKARDRALLGSLGARAAMRLAPPEPSSAERLSFLREVAENANGVLVTDDRIRARAGRELGEALTADWAVVRPLSIGRIRAREQRRSDVVVAIGPGGTAQLHHRLIAALTSFPLGGAVQLQLVGQPEDDLYGRFLAGMVESAGSDLALTFRPMTEAEEALREARLAVELSDGADSRVTRWASVARAMSVPVVVNDGTNLDPYPSASELGRVLGRAWVDQAPRQEPATARGYARFIEEHAERGPLAEQASILRRAARHPEAVDLADWTQAAVAVARNHPAVRGGRRLLVDTSILVTIDARTGIQRVVRAIARELLVHPPEGLDVRLVHFDPFGRLTQSRMYTAELLGLTLDVEDVPIVARPGDVWLGADLNIEMFRTSHAGALAQLRTVGVEIHHVLYDLLPIRHPQWFPEGLAELFPVWVRGIVRESDSILCISRAVADELRLWIKDNEPGRAAMPIGWFHLGADIEMSAPTGHRTDAFERLYQSHGPGPRILMVGTLEPRKGHLQALAAFETLWARGVDANLLIVGRAGWGFDELVSRLGSHPEAGRRLLWFDSASDAELAYLYQDADGMLQASYAEGFGLPLIEAARHDIPLLARDIPVFREVAGENASYFDAVDEEGLADSLQEWFEVLADGSAPRSGSMPWLTWEEATARFAAALRAHFRDTRDDPGMPAGR